MTAAAQDWTFHLEDANSIDWNSAVSHLPGAHILQTREWAQFKARTGWHPLPCLWRDPQGAVQAAAMVLRRAAPGGFSVLYVPRGPLVDWNDPQHAARVSADLQSLAKEQHAIFIKIDPELVVGLGVPGTEGASTASVPALEQLKAGGWRISEEQIQFRNTVWLDLHGDEQDWLARMKQKTRYNIRLAQRKGVRVRPAAPDEMPLLYRMYAETSVRDGFVIRDESYYTTLWRSFMERGMAEPLIAEVAGSQPQPEVVAAVVPFFFANRAWYLYGMSRDAHRDKMPNYLLQWEAMRRAKARGCVQYDLWGAPDTFDEHDSMWGVYRFKEGLGGQVARFAGALDYPVNGMLYVLYTRVLPRVLDLMRRRGRARTRQEVSL